MWIYRVISLLLPHSASLCHSRVSVGILDLSSSGLYETNFLLHDGQRCVIPYSTQGSVCPSHAIVRNSQKLNTIVKCWKHERVAEEKQTTKTCFQLQSVCISHRPKQRCLNPSDFRSEVVEKFILRETLCRFKTFQMNVLPSFSAV